MSHAHDHPYGSARFASPLEVRRAFRKQGGLPIGFYRGRMLSHSGQAGALLFGGAGSGKFTTILSHIMAAKGRKGEPARYAIFCPKGEMAAVIGPGLVHSGAHVYTINAYHLHGLPNHRVALYSHLVPGSRTLVADSKRIAEILVPKGFGGDSKFFEDKAQNWVDALLRGLVHADGGVSPLSLFEHVGMVRTAPEAWAEMSVHMAALGEPDLRSTYAEMRDMAENSRRTYDSVMGEITNALAHMADPALQETFTGVNEADFALDVLTEESDRPVYVFLIMPAELVAQSAAIIRGFFSTLRTLKQRKPQAPTINLVIEETYQLGRFPEVGDFYVYGRGIGLSPLCVYQDIGQPKANLGPAGAMMLSASSDIEIHLGGGISDLETAQHLSRKLGNQTLHLEDKLTNARAARARREAMHAAFVDGTDPVKTGLALRAMDTEMGHTRKMARALKTPDEILNMDPGKALVSASGYGIYPFEIDKVPYYTRKEYAGRYFPNPYFDRDMDHIRVRTRLGYQTRRVIREAVPDCFRDFPQYRNGEWQNIEGYRPTLEQKQKKTFLARALNKIRKMSKDG